MGINNTGPFCKSMLVKRHQWKRLIQTPKLKSNKNLWMYTYIFTVTYVSINGIYMLPRWHSGKESACQCRRWKRCGFDPGSGRFPGEEMATHSSILAWKIPWIEKPGGLQSMESLRIRHNWMTQHKHMCIYLNQMHIYIYIYKIHMCAC